MRTQDDKLRLQVGDPGKGIAADGFLAFFHNAVAALKELDKELSKHGSETIQWDIIEAGSNSPIFATLRGRPLPSVSHNGHSADELIAIFAAGVDMLSHSNRAPIHFSKPVLHCIKEMVSVSNRYRLNPTIAVGARRVIVAERVADNADWAMKSAALEKSKYTEYGSLCGKLKTITSVTEKRDKLVLIDRLTDTETKCYIRDRRLDEVVRKAWKYRVEVTGQIVIDRRTRKPLEVNVDAIRILPERNALPQMEDLHGIDITGGMDAVDYVRGLRDDE